MPYPNSWRRCRLAELTEKVGTWNPLNDPRENVRYVDVSGVSRDELRIVSVANYAGGQAPSRARKIVRAGDTIVATVRPTLRRIAQIPSSLDGDIVSTAFCVLRPDQDQMLPDFLFFATQLDEVMSSIRADGDRCQLPCRPRFRRPGAVGTGTSVGGATVDRVGPQLDALLDTP